MRINWKYLYTKYPTAMPIFFNILMIVMYAILTSITVFVIGESYTKFFKKKQLNIDNCIYFQEGKPVFKINEIKEI